MLQAIHTRSTFAHATSSRTSHAVLRPNCVRRQEKTRFPVAHAIGKDVVDGFMDLSSLVTGGGTGGRTPYDELATSIGRDVYVDVAGWHLFMRDMTATPALKMSQVLATQLGPKAASGGRGGLRESDIESVLRKIPVKLGGGRMQVSLYDVMPSMCVGDLCKILEDFAKSK
jgi:hypothetical protein